MNREHLRALSYDDAIAQVQMLAGIVPFSAELTMIRGVVVPDAFPHYEKGMTAAIQDFYDTDTDTDTVAAVAEQWRPYRNWVGLLLRAAAAE